ncbi:MAG: hypothetical protein DMF84_14510 [Acidobacteria bacterium]|nr:MAG: hypothetical protein DMF84_14510 [Acidobacteriota bacterium]
MTIGQRHLRLRVLEALERWAKQFRSHEDLWPFRVPHDPLPLDDIIRESLADEGGSLDAGALRARTVLRMEFDAGAIWDAWVITLPSGISLYCDTDGDETRVLASAKRSNPLEADRFFLELLAESRGHHFGIEMSGTAPDRVRSSIGDREFLVDVFVELFEGTVAEHSIQHELRQKGEGGRSRQTEDGSDFRSDVEQWLVHALVLPLSASSRPGRRRPRRLRDEIP